MTYRRQEAEELVAVVRGPWSVVRGEPGGGGAGGGGAGGIKKSVYLLRYTLFF